MMKLLIAFSLAGAGYAAVPSLNSETFASATAGKTVFIKFFAPWCGHCKAMAADWEKLAEEWAGNEIGFVAEVDCTAPESEAICQQEGVQGFPTLKYGDPSALEDYSGERSYEELSKFAKENLKPTCSPKNLDLCDDIKKGKISELMALSPEQLEEKLSVVAEETKKLEAELEGEIGKLQAKYEELMKEFDENTKKLKETADSGLVRAVLAVKGGENGKDEL